MMVNSQQSSTNTPLSLTASLPEHTASYCSSESCYCRRLDVEMYNDGKELIPPAGKHVFSCSNCGELQRVCEVFVGCEEPIACSHCGHDVRDGDEEAKGMRIVIEGMLHDHVELREAMPAGIFLGRNVQSTANEVISHVFSNSLHQTDVGCAKDAALRFAPKAAGACDFCGMNHHADQPCVSPRGALPPGAKYVTVCKGFTTVYVTDKAADDAAGGSVCPYCLTDLRERMDVRVPTLIHRLRVNS